MTTRTDYLQARYQTIAETGPGFAVINDDAQILAGRWATRALAHEHGNAGRYLLSGCTTIEVLDLPAPEQVTHAASRINEFLTRIASDDDRTILGPLASLDTQTAALVTLNADAQSCTDLAAALAKTKADTSDEIDYCGGVPLLLSDLRTLLRAQQA